MMKGKTTKKRAASNTAVKKRTQSQSPRKKAEEAGRNIRGGKGIINARRSRDERLGGIMDDLKASRKRK
jgi:hypothetical protein